jgi:tRNA-uridine 2-sulfurtransferase
MKGKKDVRVAVGLSGGVDSAVTALLLKNKGYEVVGVHLYCWPPKSEIEKDGVTRDEWIKKNGCRADEDRKSALKTALELEIPFKVLDFSEEYKEKVIEYFYDEYKKGRTPNPDVVCNSEIKFGMFLDWAIENDFDYIATGHYAKKEGSKLLIPKDKHKDQTYFLYRLGPKEMERVLFPLADLIKSEVRDLAKKAKLSAALRPDSQGICFVGKVDVREFLEKRLSKKEGTVVDIDGRVVGKHDGVWFYTIGQRGGWRLDSKAKVGDKGRRPILYIIDKKVKENLLVVGESKDALCENFNVGDLNWVGGVRPTGLNKKGLKVRIRHGGELVPVEGCDPYVGVAPLLVEMEEMQRGVALGQSAVLYTEAGECLGGGVIV